MNAATEPKTHLFVGQAVRDMYQNYGFIYKIEDDARGMFVLGGAGGMQPIRKKVHIVFTGESPHLSEVDESQAERYVGWRGIDAEPATASQLAEYINEAQHHQETARQAREAAIVEGDRRRAEFLIEAQAKLPSDAKAVLIAELRADDSDAMTDYFASHAEKTLILGFSTHTRDLFPEMRKAALNAPETALLADAPGDYEHREKYSMGSGFYLGKDKYSGWIVKKVPLYDRGAAGVPVGEWRLSSVAAPARAPAQQGRTASAASSGAFTIEEHTHTKKGFQMFIVILADRVARDEYERLLRAAQDAGGWYSRPWGKTPGGFAFKKETAAQEFAANHISGSLDTIPAQTSQERAESTTARPATATRQNNGEKFRMLAEGMQSDIDNKLGDRLENTPKRAAQGAHARLEGYRMQRAQQVLLRLADLCDAGRVPPELRKITSKAAVLAHMGAKTRRIPNGFHEFTVEETPATPSGTDPVTLALWALLDAPNPEQARQDELKRKINAVKLSGNIPGYFPTPPAVVARMIDAADIQLNHVVLEPSAGDGAIASAVPECTAVVVFEVNHTLCEILQLRGFDARPVDFMTQQPGAVRYDRVLMNPPFENQQDVHHVMHAFDFLAPGGRLVAIMSPSWQTRDNKVSEEFRAWLAAHGGTVEALPEGSFKESGTGVATVMVVIDRERAL